jgi:small GTP-binding protein
LTSLLKEGRLKMEHIVKNRIKICLLGERVIGKTSLTKRFVEDSFNEDYHPTYGTRLSRKKITVDTQEPTEAVTLDLSIWDIMGESSYRELLHPTYLKGVKGALLICDLTKRKTLANMIEWMDSMPLGWRSIPYVFVANKCDLTECQEFGPKELKEVASKYNSPYFLTSAKTGENVQDAFQTLAENIVKDWDTISPSMHISKSSEHSDSITS